MADKKRERKNDVIIVQCHALMTDEERLEIQQDLVAQAKDSIIVLPACCSLRAVLRGGANILKLEEERS